MKIHNVVILYRNVLVTFIWRAKTLTNVNSHVIINQSLFGHGFIDRYEFPPFKLLLLLLFNAKYL